MTLPPMIFTSTLSRVPGLPLHAPRRVAGREPLDLGHAHAVEITRDGLLQRARRDREPERGVRALAGDQTVDQPGGEAVAGADPIDDPHAVALTLGECRRLRVPQHRTPAIVARRYALA